MLALLLMLENPKKEDALKNNVTTEYNTDDIDSTKIGPETEAKFKSDEEFISLDDYEYENIYTIKKGETLASIARQYLDEDVDWSTVQECINRIADDNNITNNDTIAPGTKINVSFLNEITLLKDGEYIIKDEDTLSSVVRIFAGNNISWEEVENYVNELLETNPSIEKADNIKPNQKIDITSLIGDKTFAELVATYSAQGGNDIININNNTQKSVDTMDTENKISFKQTEEEKTSGTVKFKSFKRSNDATELNAMAAANVQEFIPIKKGELTGKTIMINAGHGGVTPKNMMFDGGAINNDDEEYKYTAEYSEALAQKLLDKGAKVVILQGSVYTLPDAIVHFAKENAQNIDNTAFISLHFDAFDDKTIKGTSVFYQGNKSSRPFACNIYDSMEKAGINFIHNQPIEKNLQVTRTATSDECKINNAVLVECGTISNFSDLKNIKSEDYKDKLTNSLVQAIIDSF